MVFNTSRTITIIRSTAHTTPHTTIYSISYCIQFYSILSYSSLQHTHSLYHRSHQSSISQWEYSHNKEEIPYSKSSESEIKVRIISAMQSILESRAETHHCVRCVCVYWPVRIHSLTHPQSVNQSVDRPTSQSINQSAGQECVISNIE